MKFTRYIALAALFVVGLFGISAFASGFDSIFDTNSADAGLGGNHYARADV